MWPGRATPAASRAWLELDNETSDSGAGGHAKNAAAPALPCPALLTQGISPDRDSPISLNCWVVSVLAAGKFLEFVWMLGCAWRTHIANTSHAMRREGVPGGGTAAGKFRQAGGS
jgi:hypothetical protein